MLTMINTRNIFTCIIRKDMTPLGLFDSLRIDALAMGHVPH